MESKVVFINEIVEKVAKIETRRIYPLAIHKEVNFQKLLYNCEEAFENLSICFYKC